MRCASSITPSNQSPRCDTSKGEAPTPGSETRSRWASSRTDGGNVAGPAEKLRTRSFTPKGYRTLAGRPDIIRSMHR